MHLRDKVSLIVAAYMKGADEFKPDASVYDEVSTFITHQLDQKRSENNLIKFNLLFFIFYKQHHRGSK